MKCSLTEWRRSLGACCVALSAVGLSSLSFAQSADAPDAQTQQVDAATKKLMAANGLLQRGLFKLAAQEYDGFITENPGHAQLSIARYALGVCQYRLRQYDKAVEQLRLALQDPKFEQRDEALAVIGHCELEQKHYEPALAAFDELSEKFPKSKHAELAALNRGEVLYLAKKYKESAQACDAYLQKYPAGGSRADALYFLALSQRALNQNEEAVKTLGTLTTQFPTSVHQFDALLLTGQALESLGNTDKAVAQYKQMVAAAPETRKADAHYSLGVALYKTGKFDDAAKELSTVVTDFPASPYAKPGKLQLGLVQLAGNKTGEARQTLTAVAQEDPTRAPEARYGLAQCDISEKKFEQARQVLDELSRLQPPPANAAQIALDRAVCGMELNKFQESSDELAAFRTKFPDSPQLGEVTYRQAFCLHKLNKFDASHDLCQQAAKLKLGELAPAVAELDSENLFLLKKYPEAEKGFAALAGSTKDDVRRLRFTLREGQCEYFAGNYAKAAQILQPLAADPKVAQNEELQQAGLLLGDALLQQNKYPEAAAALKLYLPVAKTEKPQAQYKLAVALMHGPDQAAAGQALNEAAQGPADSPWVQRSLLELGQFELLKEKKYDEASAALRRVLAANAPPEIAAPAAYQLGWSEYAAKRYPQAAAAWKEMAQKYPTDKYAPDAAFEQGVALRDGKQYSEAADAFQAYATAHPDGQYAMKARQLAAACLKDLGKNDAAEKMLNALATDAKGAGSDAILYDLAWAQRDAKNATGAEASYGRLLKEHPDSKLVPAARTELAELLYNDKKYDEAAAALEQVIADKSTDPKILSVAQYQLGCCYDKLNKPDKAAAIFAAYTEKGGGTDEMNASALLQAGMAYASDQKFDKAEAALTQMLQKYPTQKDASVAMLRLGEVQAGQNKYDASAATYAQFLAKYPKSEFAYRALFGIGWAQENTKKYEEARASYKKVIAATNTEYAAKAQFQIGETLLAEGKFETAIPELLAVEDVYKYPKWSAVALYEAGKAFEQLKQPDQAKQQYSEILSKYKDAPEANLAGDRLKAMTKGS